MSRLNYPQAKLSFEAPAGFRRVAAPGFLWCGRSASGERVTVQLWQHHTGLSKLVPHSSALVYAHLHKKMPGKTFLRGPAEGLQVGGAEASFSGIERLQFGKPVRSYQMLALFAGNLYLFEYTTPTPQAEKGVRAFTKLLDSVHWTGMPTAKPSVAQPEQAKLENFLGLPYLPKSRATSTQSGGVLGSGL
ncbi:hypothetical protein [Armatimonas sp.]|uniref:hypothetical protein n=1 Tax=Armatimonas sp. TaxID=1872638 RepID=UPI00374FFBA8